MVRFRWAFDELKYLPKDSYPVYQQLIEALSLGQDDMVVYALHSGTPARLPKSEVASVPSVWRPLNVLGFLFTFGVGSAWGNRYYRDELFASTEPLRRAVRLIEQDRTSLSRAARFCRTSVEDMLERVERLGVQTDRITESPRVR